VDSDGLPAALVVTVGVAALAVAAAIGAHVVLPAAHAASPTPSVSTPATSAALSDDFCTLMTDLTAVAQTLQSDPPGFSDSIDVSPSPSASATPDPAAVDALHAWGQNVLDASATIVRYYDKAATIVADPDIATAFTTMSTDTPLVAGKIGQAAIDAASDSDFMTAVFGVMFDPTTAAASSDLDGATTVVGQYVTTTCGVDVFGTGAQAATDAKSDASTLGMEIATYYVDWKLGDPAPVVTVTDGNYFLNDNFIGFAADGAAITAQYANGPTDWCVEVTINGDSTTSATYSAQIGLAQGTCPSGSA